MSKIKLPIISLIFIICIQYSVAQKKKPFEGIIEYKVKYKLNDDSKGFPQELPEKIQVMYKNNNFKTSLYTEFGNAVIIGDNTSNTMYFLLDVNGKKIALEKKLTEFQNKSDEATEVWIKYDDDTCRICDLTCKKATVFINNEKYPLFFTEEIHFEDPNWFTYFRGIKNILLQYTVPVNGILTEYTATHIEHKKLKKKVFSIPEGYTVYTENQLESILDK